MVISNHSSPIPSLLRFHPPDIELPQRLFSHSSVPVHRIHILYAHNHHLNTTDPGHRKTKLTFVSYSIGTTIEYLQGDYDL